MPVIIDQRVSWFVGAVGAMLVAGAVFLGVVMFSVYERMLGVCFERTSLECKTDSNPNAIELSTSLQNNSSLIGL
jgi:hypothetical protein